MDKYVSKSMLYNLCQPSGVFRLHVAHIDQMPAADVVSVTRCKDCVRSFFDSRHNCRWCRRNWGRILVEDNDFCSYGKQKEGNKEAEEKFLSTLSTEGRELYFKLIKGEL